MSSHKKNSYTLPKAKIQGPSYRGIPGDAERTAENRPNWRNDLNKAAAVVGVAGIAAEAAIMRHVFFGGGPKVGGGGGSNGLPSSNKIK